MQILKTLALELAACAALTACTTITETALVNDAGQKRFCYLTNDHTLISVGAVAEYNRCLNDAGAAGFRKTSP